jgi:hypothetical protein
MKRLITSSGVTAALLLGIAACGSTTSTPAASSSATAAAPSSAAPAALNCSQISAPLSKALADLKTSDAHYQEAWVSGGYQADLQALIDATSSSGSGTSLSSDAAAFNKDASGYLSEAVGGMLAPGWQTGYAQVTSDINAMATDCGLSTVPANTPANS